MISSPNLDIQYYANGLANFFTNHYSSVWGSLQSLVGLIIGLSIVISIILLVAIVATVEALKHVRKQEEEMYSKPIEPAYIDSNAGDNVFTNRWRKVMDHISTDNQNDWRQAIIEADIMLEDLLVKLGYQGEGIGERLRRVKTGDFKSIDQAGEAHGIRNRIAHDGSNYTLNKVEAQRVIGLYRQVFSEFYTLS